MLHTSLHTATFPVSAWVTFSTVALTQAGHVARPAQVQVGGRRDLTYWEDSKVTEVGKTCGHVCNLPTELPVRLDPGTQAASLRVTLPGRRGRGLRSRDIIAVNSLASRSGTWKGHSWKVAGRRSGKEGRG